MYPLFYKWSLKLNLYFFLLSLCFSCGQRETVDNESKLNDQPTQSNTIDLQVDSFNIISKNRLSLTENYAQEHYGLDSYVNDSVKMIVVHYTVIPNLKATLDYFKPDSIESGRKNIQKFSWLNVGIHYVIDRNGDIYNLMPDSIMARHLIGFNHVGIGIENVANDSTQLTSAQMDSNVNLIAYLKNRHNSIEYLIGHQEYDNEELPHYKLMVSKNPNYKPYPKFDPGMQFMDSIRKKLKVDYEIQLQK